MSAPTDPKIKVGDRVQRSYDVPGMGTVSDVYSVYTVSWDDGGPRGAVGFGRGYLDRDLELAPPEPPAPKWTVEYSPSIHGDWLVTKPGEPTERLYSESLARQVRDLLNSEQPDSTPAL